MSHHRIEARQVSYTYPDGHAALHDASFLITHGESVGIIGANGAGKSTLFMLLLGVLFPQTGHVLVGDVKLSQATLPGIRPHMGMVFQQSDDQLFMPTVFEDVAFGPRNSGLSETEIRGRVTGALEQVGLAGFETRAPFRLSGGEKRAAAIASVLSMQPDILILDEPTSDLDPKARRRMMGILQGFTHTKLVASHDLDLVMDICSRVIVLSAGRVVADGAGMDVLRDKALFESAGLELPLSLQRCGDCRYTFSGAD